MKKRALGIVIAAIVIGVSSSVLSCGTDTVAIPTSGPGQPGTAVPTPNPTSTSTSMSVTVPIMPGAMNQGAAAFGANPLSIPIGATVTWVNQDNVPHTATSDTGVWDSLLIAPGQSFSFTFANAGGFPYHCAIHGAANMSGMIQVGPPSAQPTPTPTVSASPAPLGPPTYASVNRNVLIPHCIICHSGPNPSAGLDFTTYAHLISNPVMPNLVVPGKPDSSTLYLDIQGGTAPGSTEFLTQDEIQLVFDWIQMGALNN